MNYPESKIILEEIKKAKKILINCHRSPDPDSISSALSMYKVLTKKDKDVSIYCPTPIPDSVSFLSDFEKIKYADFNKVDLESFDLILILDTSSWDHATGLEFQSDKIRLKTINIDHHQSNDAFGFINLVDRKTIANCEVLYLIYEDWGVEIDKNIAAILLTGILSDSGVFRYPGVTSRTLDIGKRLLEKNVDMQKIIFHLNFTISFKQMQFWGWVLSNLKLDNEFNFVWVAVPHKLYREYGREKFLRESTSSQFFQSVEGTDFGIFMCEEKKNNLNVSFRSRTGIDVSKMAKELGGGGHIYAGGGGIKELEFNEAVEKVLLVAKKYAQEYNKKNKKDN